MAMSVVDTLQFIRRHPIGSRRTVRCLGDWLRWQIGARIVGAPVAVDWIGGARLLVSPGMSGATGNIYVGLHEFEEMAFIGHLLRAGDLFVDIGANVGTFSVLAAAVAQAEVRAYEPHPKTYARLVDNLRINRLEAHAAASQMALGERAGEVQFTAELDCVNHVRSPEDSAEVNLVSVKLGRLDDELAGRVPTAMKIDVEGFEGAVLAGGAQTLGDKRLLAVVMELNGSGLRYGVHDAALHKRMLEAGFIPCAYEPFDRLLSERPTTECPQGNGIYVRRGALAHVQEVLRSAAPLIVKGETV